MKPIGLLLATFALVFSTACSTKERCVADCDAEAEAESEPGDPSAPQSLACEDARDEATAFVQANRACETVLDCTALDGICYGGGDVPNPCGAIGVSKDADVAAWEEIRDEMQGECECGAAACGPALICNEANECEAVFGDQQRICDSLAADAQAYLDEFNTCEVDADCLPYASSCVVNDGCAGVWLNAESSAEDWAQLDNALLECRTDGTYCNYVGECANDVMCSDEGRCVIRE